jgi:hypothetical protein
MSNLYKRKDIKCGFIILSPECSIKPLIITVNSIRNYYPQSNLICVFSQTCQTQIVDDASKYCSSYIKGNCITEMLNHGMQHAPCEEWNFIIISGSYLRNCLDKKFSYFIENEKDILFPLVNKKMNFVDGTINGMLIQKKSFDDIGEFPDEGSLEMNKSFWASTAVVKGYKFKAILGVKLNYK